MAAAETTQKRGDKDVGRAPTESDTGSFLRLGTAPLGSSGSPDGALPTGFPVGDYEIVAKIAEGGMGAVYAAHHPVIGKRVAIKVLRREMCAIAGVRERFVHEAQAVNRISHPNLVDIFAIGELDDGRPYLVMEYLEGETLADRMDRGRLPVLEAIEVLLPVCRALAAAHDGGVVHRDLKPENIFLAYAGGERRVVLLDFGVAKLQGTPLEPGLTSPGTMVGTPEFMAPEQVRGEDIDGRTDIYALGTIAYALFLEGVPFTAESPMVVIAAHLSEAPPVPSDLWPDIPSPLESLLLAMVHKQRDRRPDISTIVGVLLAVREEIADRINRSERVGASSRSREAARAARYDGLDVTGPVPSIASAAPSGSLTVPTRRRRGVLVGAVVAGALAALAVVFLVGHGGAAGLLSERLAGDVPPPPPEQPSPRAEPAAVPAAVVPAAAEAAPTTGFVVLAVNPRRASVRVDGDAVDLDDGRVELELAPGEHLVEIVATRRKPHRETVRVAAGDHIALPVTLERVSRRRGHRDRASSQDAPDESFDRDGTIDPFAR